jgi:hypothetical protein
MRKFWLCTIACGLVASEAWARGGGGGGGGGGGHGGYHGTGNLWSNPPLAILLGILFATVFGWQGWMEYDRFRHLARGCMNTRARLAELARLDPMWDAEGLRSLVEHRFRLIQAAWCDQDIAALQGWLGPDLMQEWHDEIADLRTRGVHNVLEDLQVTRIRLVHVRTEGQGTPRFTAEIAATCIDYALNAKGRKVPLKPGQPRNFAKQRTPFTEFWIFARDGQDWQLQRIHQKDGWQQALELAGT